MILPRHRLAWLGVLVLALALAAPAMAHAAGAPPATARPLMIMPDRYEPDDTTATAQVLPEVSYHSFDSSGAPMAPGYVPDVDMFKIEAEATGTPFVIEAQQTGGYFACSMTAAEVDATGTLVPLQESIGLWGTTVGNTLFFTAPHPGTFYVSIEPFLFGNGTYELFVSEGIARRIYGVDRAQTAVEISRLMWPNADNPLGDFLSQMADSPAIGPSGVVIARRDDFADALAGSAFAAKVPQLGMPVLLTARDSLPPVAWFEVYRLAQARLWTHQPFTVYVLGNESAISDNVRIQLELLAEGDLDAKLLDVVRVAGDNRFETAAQIAAIETSPSVEASDTAFLVNGFAFPDALSAAPVAAHAAGPLLMTKPLSLPAATRDYLLDHPEFTTIVVAGSPSSVSTAVVEELEAAPLSRTVVRIAGANRFQTSLALAEYGVENWGMNAGSILLASGAKFPDGLAATPMTAFTGGPLLLTKPAVLSTEVAAFYTTYGPTNLPSYVIGGEASVGEVTFNQFDELWKTEE
jgi:putative cell wall-binding protein